MDILQQLYYGELYESENVIREMPLKETSDIKNLIKAYDALMGTLSNEQKELFKKWEEEDEKNWSNNVEAAYIRGFKTGALMAIEVHR